MTKINLMVQLKEVGYYSINT